MGGRAGEGKRVLECTLKIERQTEVREGGSIGTMGWREEFVGWKWEEFYTNCGWGGGMRGKKDTNLNPKNRIMTAPVIFHATLIPVHSGNPVPPNAECNYMNRWQMKNHGERRGDGIDVRAHTHLCSQIHTKQPLSLSGLHGEGLLLLLVAYVLWISLVAERGSCNPCISPSSRRYRFLAANASNLPLFTLLLCVLFPDWKRE